MNTIATQTSKRSALLSYFSLFTSVSTLLCLRAPGVACPVWAGSIGRVDALIFALAGDALTAQGMDVFRVRRADRVELCEYLLDRAAATNGGMQSRLPRRLRAGEQAQPNLAVGFGQVDRGDIRPC